MEVKTTSIMILTFFLANMFAGALIFSATTVSAQNGIVVGASLGRYRVYNSDDYFEDSVSGNVTGYLRSRYEISPQADVEIENANIVLETPFGPGNFTNISWDPGAIYTEVLDEVSGNWTYAWNFSTLPLGRAMVSLPTIFEVDFDPGFDCQRIWNPWITSEFVTQTLTTVFTPSTMFADFHNVHVSVQIPNTTEASLIDIGSVSATPPTDQNGTAWNKWWNVTTGEVNWQGNPAPGTTYHFSVDVTVENKLFPDPIFYKPSAGFGANFAPSFSDPDIPYPKIGDDINRDGDVESSVTYNGTGAFAWEESAQSENVVSLPWFSSVVSFFDAGTWNETTYYVDTVSNSTVTDFYFSEDDMLIRFNVTGPDGTVGFCRVSIPNELLWVDNTEQWQVWVNNTLIEDRKIMEDTNYTYIYFTYNQSIQEVQIKGIHVIPEFPAWTPILLILTVLSVAIAVCKRRILKTPIH